MSDNNNNNRVFDENVVMFPASKNFPPVVDSVDLHDDPLEALLTEFDDIADSDFDYDLEEELAEIARENLSMQQENQTIHNLALMEQDELRETISKQMEFLSDTQKRISHLLKEIDSYMPGKK